MEVKEILKKLVSFNTIKDYQNKEILDFAEEYLKKYNFKVLRIEKCLIAYNSEKPTVGFVGHTDTVDYNTWDGDPFSLYEEGDKLIGLGSCDMKGGIAAILAAVSKLDLEKNKLAIYLTNDEEIGFTGIKTIKDNIVPENIIIGEPTSNVPIYGTKGVLEFVVDFLGVKCHSSTPEKGKSAILECVNFINELQVYYNEVLKKDRVNNFSIPYTTMNIGMINGGETVNSVPGKCSMTIDFRIAKEEHLVSIIDSVNQISKKYECNISIKNSVLPKINDSDISFLEKLACKKETKCYITEGSFIDKNFVILGPGPDTAHQKNEFISYNSLKKAEELYIKIIEFYNKKGRKDI